jgi:hypothetical protein
LAKKRKNKEISVSAPDYIPKRAPVFKDTTGTEALDVFKVAQTVSKFLSFGMLAIGIFVIVMSVYSLSISANMFLNPSFIIILGIIGALNVFCGLILLAKK